MRRSIQETEFVDILKDGVGRTALYMGQLTEYRGGPTTTEYILTTDIARAFLDKHYEVGVEFLNRKFLNAMTRRRNWNSREKIGSKRTDIAIVDGEILPLAIIETKIGVGSKLSPIRKDLAKIANTIESMKAAVAENVRGASVFQVHVRNRTKNVTIDQLKEKVREIETSLEAELEDYKKGWPDFTFRLVPLLRENEGFAPTEILEDEDGTKIQGEKGHATRYYAVLITSVRKQKKPMPFGIDSKVTENTRR